MATKKKTEIPKDCMPSCGGCSFSVFEPKEELGMCRRYPPTMLIREDGDFEAVLPVVSLECWCGEFHRKTS